MAAEAKLGKSLDAIIEENRKKLSTRRVGDKPRGDRAAGKPKGTGMRIDGARKPRFQAGKPRGQDKPQRAAPAQAQRAQAGGLAVRAAGIRKRSNRPAALGYDDMDTDDYGAPPPRQQGGGGGGGGFRRRERDVPRGNSDGFWSHDLYDDTDHAPARRIHQAGRGSGPAQAQGVSLRVSNLGYKVTQNDITELFETCGTLLGAFIHYDNSGRSEGMATVVYQRRPDAQKAIDEYNGVKLDGKELIIEYSDDVHPVVQLSSGKTLVRPSDVRGGAQNNNFRRAVNDSLPIRGMGGSPIRSTGAPSRPTGGASRLYAGGGGGGIGRGGGRPVGGRSGGINGRLRSAVGAQKTKEQLDAEMDMVE